MILSNYLDEIAEIKHLGGASQIALFSDEEACPSPLANILGNEGQERPRLSFPER